MNHVIVNRVLAAWFSLTQLWTRVVDEPIKNLVDQLHQQKEALLAWMFLGNGLGLWVYNRTSATWWTDLRFGLCWVPPLFIVLGWNIAAGMATPLIWSTDAFDGWFARAKQQASDEGGRYETTVDTIFKLLIFVAIWFRYDYLRFLVSLAGGLELLRIFGALYLIWNGFQPRPNRSGQVKTWFYIAGVGLLLFYSCRLVAWLMIGGLILSGYSMGMHVLKYRAWRRSRT